MRLDEALDRVIGLVDQLVEVDKAGAASDHIRPMEGEPVAMRCDVAALVLRSQRRYAQLFEPTIGFVVDVPSTRAVIAMDPDRINLIIFELLRLTRDATRDGGVVRLLVESQDKQVSITVQSSEPGEPPRAQGPRPPHPGPRQAGVDFWAFWSQALSASSVALHSHPEGNTFRLTFPAE